MKIVPGSEQLITNAEVIQVLSERAAERRNNSLPVLSSESKVHSYLIEQSGEQSTASLQAFTNAVKDYNVTKPEVLQLLNLRPQQLVELNLVIKGLDDRLTEEQQEELLQTVKRILGERTPLAAAS